MTQHRRVYQALICFLLAVPVLLSQTAITGRAARPLITSRVDETHLHQLSGNTRPEAKTANDLGAVPEGFAMQHILVQLQRSAAQETAVSQYIASLQDPKSPNYHKWMTAAQFGQAYGASQQDLDTITGWLASKGFTVNSVYPSGMVIDISGTAGQVQQAFHTSIHYLDVNGQEHVANMSDPEIPEALAPVVAGIVSLHDFAPHAMNKPRPHANFTYTAQGYTNEALSPSDLATIYNIAPLFAQGVTGQGQTIAVIEDTDLYSTDDWNTFVSTFGVNQYAGTGSLTAVHPSPATGRTNCSDPGVVGGNDGEAILDAEWSAAAAPDAAIQVASCADTRTTFGGLIALQNLINAVNPPSIVSISYGECEAGNGETSNASFNLIYQQAAAEGISVFVAAGDEGAAACDSGASGATHGIGVSGWASTPYNVAAGGTDFADAYLNTVSTYWNSTNTSTYGSAITYIPEIPWDDSCGSGIISSYLGFASPYGVDGLCGSSAAKQEGLVQVAAGSGGPSGCATGSPSISGVVSGSCQGYAKPSWQSGLAGVPSDGVRDLPDVSLFSGTGVWGHYYVMCFSDRRNGGASCAGDPSTWAGGGGTSFSAPILAGIQALVNQKTGSAQGNPNPVYYSLAANPGAVCDSMNGDSASSACIFHNVTLGDSAVNCSGAYNCYGASAATTPSGTRRGPGGGSGSTSMNGALSTSTQSYAAAFATAAGWNFTNGIGSLNVLNLVNNWPSGQ
jgi:subtilase family serine protease